MSDQTQTKTSAPDAAPAAPAAPQATIQDHVNGQKQALVNKAQELINISHNIIDSWLNNFIIAEKIKTRRTDQVNTLLNFVNQLANEGVPQINSIGNEIKDPETSNKVLECNNAIMTAARNLLNTIQQQEAAFQQEIQAAMSPPSQGPKTEVIAKEA